MPSIPANELKTRGVTAIEQALAETKASGNSARLLRHQSREVREPRHLRPKRERHHQAKHREGEEVRASKRLGGFGALAARGRSPGFTD